MEQTLTANSSGLAYDTESGQCTYMWKASKDWAGTYRQLVMKLVGGPVHHFKRTAQAANVRAARR